MRPFLAALAASALVSACTDHGTPRYVAEIHQIDDEPKNTPKVSRTTEPDGADDVTPAISPDDDALAPQLNALPLVESVRSEGFQDATYALLGAANSDPSYRSAQALGLALPPGTRGPGVKPLWRCDGKKNRAAGGPAPSSFFSAAETCAGNEFANGRIDAVTEVAVIHTQAPEVPGSLIPVFRYWTRRDGARTSVLSTVPPNPVARNILRYEPDPVLGDHPLGYILPLGALDANERWILGNDQRFCFGISAFQSRCPDAGRTLRWSLTDLRTGKKLWESTTKGSGDATILSATITDLVTRTLITPHRPMLLTVDDDGVVLAAKNVRVVRTPFLSQYDNLQDPTGATLAPRHFAPTEASALLLANQRTAHTALTADALAARADDPALFDGIITEIYGDPHAFLPGTAQQIEQAQTEGFHAMDGRGVLLGTEFTGKLYANGRMIFPFDSAVARPFTRASQVLVSGGMDFAEASALARGAIDYATYEVKGLADEDAASQSHRMLALRAAGNGGVRVGLHVESEGPAVELGGHPMATAMGAVFAGGFQTPSFDLVWNWEAQCEFLLTMKPADPGRDERLSIEPGPGGFEAGDLGGYAPLVDAYEGALGRYCLYRHQHHNLGKTCTDDGCADLRPLDALRDNIRELLDWRSRYIAAQN